MLQAMGWQGWARAARLGVAAGAVMVLSGCVTVTDSKGNSQTLGQFIDGMRTVLPFGQPANGQAAAPAGGAATQGAAGGGQGGGQGVGTDSGSVQSAVQAQAQAQAVGQGQAANSRMWREGEVVGYQAPEWTSKEDDPRVMVPAGAPGKSSSYFRAANGCRFVDPFTINVDVDMAYVKAMREWEFSTPEAMEAARQRTVHFWLSPLWRHDRTPGAYYHLSREPYVRGPQGEKRKMYLDVKLSKAGPSATLVEFIYCVRPLEGLWDTTLEGHRYYQKHFVEVMKR